MAKTVSIKTLNTLGFDIAGSYDSGAGEAGSEVVAHHDGRLYVTNGADDRIDIFDAASETLITSLDLTLIANYDGVNSVTVSDAGIAVAVQRADATDTPMNGVVAFYDLAATAGDAPAQTIEVGNLPDMVTFSKDGAYIFVANEGEPTDGGDPAGSISVIEVATMTATTVGFEAFDDQAEALQAAGVRLFPGVLPSTDFEPEYIAEGPDGTLFVTLQEANAVAVFDLATMSFTEILPLGTTDHSVAGYGIDPNDKDDAIDIHAVPVEGLHMPDAIATVELKGKTYFLTANEGDDRGDFDEGGDAARVGDIVDGDVAGVSIDPDAYTAEELADLERLTVSIIDGDTDGDGDIDVLHAYGSRSFSIFDANGKLVFDSGDQFETLISQLRPANAFNNDSYPSDDADVVDENRSDNKGPEPEAIAVGDVDGRTLAFIGLERDGGIMIYDISNPKKAKFLDYIDSSENGDASPEVIKFIAAEDSLTGTDQIAVSYEMSGTTALYDIAFGQKINGTKGADILTGTVADDRISSDQGNDQLFGGAGDDSLFGRKGADVLNGGTGDDTLRGGAGADTFVFALGDGDDVIVGLNRNDKIDLSATGLEFADLTITHTGGAHYTVEYGDLGDTIALTLTGGNPVLTADDFLF
ncbi:MAG: choice-of-anchor I family protein [Pseudodonghicola sp.]